MRNAGIVYSRKGPGGGYMLARSPDDIKIGHVIRTIDGPLAPIACASRAAHQACRDCHNVATCEVRLTMTKVRDAMSEVLDRVTLAEMVATNKSRLRKENVTRVVTRKARARGRRSSRHGIRADGTSKFTRFV